MPSVTFLIAYFIADKNGEICKGKQARSEESAPALHQEVRNHVDPDSATTLFYRSICVGKDWKYCHVKFGRRWDANCAKSRQRHKARFPQCRILFWKVWEMRELKRGPLEDKKKYEKRLNVKR